MAGINVTVASNGEVRDCVFDDTDTEGSGGSSLSINGTVSNTEIVMSTVDATFTLASDRITDCEFTLNEVDVASGVITGTKIVCDVIELSGDDVAFEAGQLNLSPGSGVNEGVLISGDLVALSDTLIIAINPYATNTAQAVSISGDYALLDGLRFKRTGTKAWEYLIEDAGGTSTIGAYATTTAAYATGEIAP